MLPAPKYGQIIPLGHEVEEATRSPLALATLVPSKRLELRVGKMGVTYRKAILKIQFK
jgi:hypothetical protein